MTENMPATPELDENLELSPIRKRRTRRDNSQERKRYLWLIPLLVLLVVGICALFGLVSLKSKKSPRATPTELKFVGAFSTFVPIPATIVPTTIVTAIPMATPTWIVLADVQVDNPFFFQAHRAVNEGYIDSAGLNVLCADQECIVPRWQAAIYYLRLEHGPDYQPPSEAKGDIFADVGKDHPGAAWIEALWNEGFTAGCNTNPLSYCPDDPLIKFHAAVFLTRFAYPELLREDCSPRPALGDLYGDIPKDPPENFPWGNRWAEICTYMGICPYPWKNPTPLPNFLGFEPITKDLFAYQAMTALDFYNQYLSGGFTPDLSLIVCATPTPVP